MLTEAITLPTEVSNGHFFSESLTGDQGQAPDWPFLNLMISLNLSFPFVREDYRNYQVPQSEMLQRH